MDMRNERFLEAVDTVILEKRNREGIGRLGEKIVHASLKLFYDSDRTHHEVKYEGFVADILNDSGIVEIQTGSFTPLKRKLEAFLPRSPVTVVHPIPRQTTVIWIYPVSGEFSAPRKSPKRENVCGVFRQLVSILPYLESDNLTVALLFLDVEEYRMLHPKYGKRRSTRYERVPTALGEEILLKTPDDYAALLPDALPEEFTAQVFSKLAKVRGMALSAALKVLLTLGVLSREKVGRGYLYRRNDKKKADCQNRA